MVALRGAWHRQAHRLVASGMHYQTIEPHRLVKPMSDICAYVHVPSWHVQQLCSVLLLLHHCLLGGAVMRHVVQPVFLMSRWQLSAKFELSGVYASSPAPDRELGT